VARTARSGTSEPSAEETGREIRPELQVLVNGIDFEDDGFGLEILQRDVKATRRVALWWD